MFPTYSQLRSNITLRLKLVWLFYRGMAFYLALFNVSSLVLYYRLHGEALGYIFWTKFLGYATATYFTFYFRRNQFYFYQNLGLSRRALFTGAFLLDLLLLCFCLIGFAVITAHGYAPPGN